VTWTDGVGETGYTVEYKQLAAATCAAEDWSGSTSASFAANTVSHPATGLAMGVTYCFRVKASNSAGSSPWTAAMTQVTWLPAPTLNTLSGVTPIKIDLSWSNVTGNTGYKIERSLNNSTWNQLATCAERFPQRHANPADLLLSLSAKQPGLSGYQTCRTSRRRHISPCHPFGMQRLRYPSWTDVFNTATNRAEPNNTPDQIPRRPEAYLL